MPTKISILRWMLFSGKKQNAPYNNHDEEWLVKNWSVYMQRTFEGNPDEAVAELQRMVETEKTPEVKANN